MDILEVYFIGEDGKCKSLQFATSSWYHKPEIISSIAFKLQHYCNIRFLFATSSKYGCRQFPVRQFRSFPVYCLDFVDYKTELPWIVPEFNDFASVEFNPTDLIKNLKILKDTWPSLFVDEFLVSELPF